MRTNVFLTLDTRAQKADATYPIVLRIIHHRQSAQVPTGVSVRKQDWDAEAKRILPTYKGTQGLTRLNNLLAKKQTEAMDLMLRLEENKQLGTYTAKQLKAMVERRSDRASFISYAMAVADQLHEAKKIGNARIHYTTINVLKTFAGGSLQFNQINYAFLNKFELNHLKNGGSLNGLSVYLRTIRAIYNRAIKEGVVDEALYPFKAYTIKGTKTHKRAIAANAIKRIEELSIDANHPLYHTRNYFLFSYYARGMTFADMAELKVSNLIDGRIVYFRKKTEQPIDIKAIPQIQEILDIYLQGKDRDDYVFPIIKRTGAAEQYKDMEWARKRYNRKLRQLAKQCNIEERLSSYVSRHSFGSRAKQLRIPIANISEMLGHNNIKTTEIYLSGLSSDEMDDLHQQVLGK